MKYENSYSTIMCMYRPVYQYMPPVPEQEDKNLPSPAMRSEDAQSLNSALNILKEKTNLLKDSILEIKLQIEERKILARIVTESLDKLIWKNKEKLLTLERIMGTHNPVTFERKTELEKEMNRMDDEKLQAEVQLWSDVTALQRDLREVVREYKESIKAEFLE